MRSRVICDSCHLKRFCLPSGLRKSEVASLDKIVVRPSPLESGQPLFRTGDPFESIYIVRSGSLKCSVPAQFDHAEKITGIYLPSEFVGLAGIGTGMHLCTAQSLERTSVCAIPFDKLSKLAGRVKNLGRRLIQVLGEKVCLDHYLIAALGTPAAERRLAALLVIFSARLKRLGWAEDEIHPSLCRIDIGNYLGVSERTINRVLATFQRNGLVQTERRRVMIRNLPALQAIAGHITPFD